MKRLIIFLICILTYSISYSNKSIYVSLSGNDNYEGNIKRPFRTIKRAIEEATNKTDLKTIILREGIYYQEKSLELANMKNITLTAYPNETVYITGGISIKKNIFQL